MSMKLKFIFSPSNFKTKMLLLNFIALDCSLSLFTIKMKSILRWQARLIRQRHWTLIEMNWKQSHTLLVLFNPAHKWVCNLNRIHFKTKNMTFQVIFFYKFINPQTEKINVLFTNDIKKGTYFKLTVVFKLF